MLNMRVNSAMLGAALRYAALNGHNERTIAAVKQCSTDLEIRMIISLAEMYLDEIYNARRTSANGKWQWRHKIPDNLDWNEINLLCELVGCWMDSKDNFYVNQNHSDWMTW